MRANTLGLDIDGLRSVSTPVEGFPVISRIRILLLSALFFFICFGLGYPSLNRVNWRTYAFPT